MQSVLDVAFLTVLLGNFRQKAQNTRNKETTQKISIL